MINLYSYGFLLSTFYYQIVVSTDLGLSFIKENESDYSVRIYFQFDHVRFTESRLRANS